MSASKRGEEDPDHPNCSQCLPIAAPGGQCDPYGGGPACPDGYDCSTDEKVCVIKMTPEPPPPPVGLGESCADNPCEAPLLCTADPERPDAGPFCLARTALGQPCATAYECVLEGYCSAALLCEQRPGDGEPCATDFGGTPRCLASLLCDTEAPDGATCRGLFQAGEPCTPDPLGRFQLLQGRCDSGLFCDCTDESCATGKCVNIAFESDPCGDEPNTACAPGTECIAGVCVGVESQGKFDAFCGG